MPSEIISTEKTRLRELEAVVDKGINVVFDVACALTEIRDQRLYKLHREGITFEQYVKERFDYSRARAYQLIDYAKMSTQVDIPNEKVGRVVKDLPPASQQFVLDQAEERFGENPSSTQVQAVRDELIDEPPAPPKRLPVYDMDAGVRYGRIKFTVYDEKDNVEKSYVSPRFALNQNEYDALRYSKTDKRASELGAQFFHTKTEYDSRARERSSFFGN